MSVLLMPPAARFGKLCRLFHLSDVGEHKSCCHRISRALASADIAPSADDAVISEFFHQHFRSLEILCRAAYEYDSGDVSQIVVRRDFPERTECICDKYFPFRFPAHLNDLLHGNLFLDPDQSVFGQKYNSSEEARINGFVHECHLSVFHPHMEE